MAIGFAGAALVLHVAGTLLIKAIRPLAQARWFPLRHAVLQLSRPGSQARIVLLAVGLGSFFIVGVRSLQENLVREFTVNLSPEMPDMFLLDVQQDQVAGDADAARAVSAPGAPPPRLIPVLRARVTGVMGQEVSLENYEDVRGRGSLAREYTVTYRPSLSSQRVGAGGPVLGRHAVGGRRGFDRREPAGAVPHQRRRHGALRCDGQRRGGAGHAAFGASNGPTAAPAASCSCSARVCSTSVPHGSISFFRGPDDPAARARLQGTIVTRYPNVSVIDGREMITAIRTVVDNVTLAVTVVGSLVLFSGLLILVGAVAMTKFRRIYEAAIFKTLGATRRTIASVLFVEYGMLGAARRHHRVGRRDRAHLGHQPVRARDPVAPLPGLSAIGVVVSAVLVAAVGVVGFVGSAAAKAAGDAARRVAGGLRRSRASAMITA